MRPIFSRTGPRPPRAPWRLPLLVGGVLLAHVWLLASPLLPAATPALHPSDPPVLRTRTVVLTPPAKAAVATEARRAAAPLPRPAQPVRPAPRPSTAPTSLAVTPAVTEALAEPSTEAVPAVDEQVSEAVAEPATLEPTPPPIEAASETPEVVAAVGHTELASAPRSAAPGRAVPFVPPPSARLHYEVRAEFRGVTQTLEGSLDWEMDDHRYRMHMVISLGFLGSRVQTSEGRVGPHGLHPQRFAEKTRSERAAHFDEAGARIRYSANTPDAVLLPGHQDRLSVFMQLAGLAQGQPERFAAGRTLQIPTSGSRESEVWSFEVLGPQPVALTSGEVAALHLRRLPRKEFDSTVEVWLAPSMGHLPVRMRITQANGDVADQRLRTP